MASATRPHSVVAAASYLWPENHTFQKCLDIQMVILKKFITCYSNIDIICLDLKLFRKVPCLSRPANFAVSTRQQA